MVHTLGHSLGAVHDENNNGSCTPGRWIMSPFGFYPNVTTKDTHNLSSRCSEVDFRDHLSRQPDCLPRPTDEDFLKNFCEDPRGFSDAKFG